MGTAVTIPDDEPLELIVALTHVGTWARVGTSRTFPLVIGADRSVPPNVNRRALPRFAALVGDPPYTAAVTAGASLVGRRLPTSITSPRSCLTCPLSVV